MNSFLKMIAAVQSVVHMPRVIAGWSFGLWKRSTASRLTFICVGLSLVACRAQAQFHLYETCTPPPASNCGAVPIPDYPGGPAELSLTVPFDPAGTFITDIEVRLWIQHTYQGDLVIEIISPAGTTVTLVSRPGLGGGFSADDFGGFAHDNQNIYFGPFALNDFSFINNFIYDYPGVPFPGIDFSQSPFGFPAVGLRTFLPVTPLSALRGENKTGTWTLRVTDMALQDVGNIRYLGLGITTHPLTQPVATISMPSAFASACNPTTIIGTANDPDGALTSYTVEFASNPQGPWATIGGGTAAVVNGALAVWNTVATGATEGFKFVRLTATNEIGLSSSFVTILYVDQGFNGINVRTPTAGAILGGTVCPDGSITDYSFALTSPPGPRSPRSTPSIRRMLRTRARSRMTPSRRGIPAAAARPQRMARTACGSWEPTRAGTPPPSPATS
jgi:subtilisin-like proprotein convertase family protein